MTHFRGLRMLGEPERYAPLCSTLAEPVTGEVTRAIDEVTCNDCRRIVRLPPIRYDDESARRYP